MRCLARARAWHHSWMSSLQRTTATVLVVLLVAALYGLWSARDPVVPAPVVVATNNRVPVIDQSALLTAQRLARLAVTPEELPFAHSAVQTADHELDLAFSGALRAIEAHPPVASPEV